MTVLFLHLVVSVVFQLLRWFTGKEEVKSGIWKSRRSVMDYKFKEVCPNLGLKIDQPRFWALTEAEIVRGLTALDIDPP